jgi:Flp pilus assembly pilin Flp
VKLFTMIEAFRNDEAGAVTVDWVVLTAAIVGLGLAVIASVRNGANSLASNISTSLSGASVAQIGPVGFSN